MRSLLLALPFLAVSNLAAQSVVYLQESFDDLVLPPGWHVHQLPGPTATWSVVGMGTNPPIAPFSGAGQLKFNSYDALPGGESRVTSARVNLSLAATPLLHFFLFHDEEFPGSMDSVYVEVTSGDSITGPWSVVRGIQRYRESSGWESAVISLHDWRGEPRVFVGLRGRSQFGNNIFLDEVLIVDSVLHDIGTLALLTDMRSAERPRNGNLLDLGRSSEICKQTEPLRSFGDPILRAVVTNFGTVPESTYQLGWSVNGVHQVPVQNSFPLAVSTQDTLSVPWQSPPPGAYSISVWTMLASDANPTNDTAGVLITIPDSTIVFYEGFNSGQFPPAHWTTINRDGASLGSWFQGSPSSPVPPFEGMGFAANNFLRANGFYLDDYLITPPLSGIGQPGLSDSLVFWIRSVLNSPPVPNYADSVMILLSTTGVDTSDFTIVLDYIEAPKSGWIRKAYHITPFVPPLSTVYVAFRHLHYDGGEQGSSSDFVGIDQVMLKREVPTTLFEEEFTVVKSPSIQNFPNPFNPTTSIEYYLPLSAYISLEVFDILGRHVDVIISGVHISGNHRTTWNAGRFAGGMYILRLTTPSFTISQKMLLLR